MIRALLYLIGAILLISVIRSVIGVVMKFASAWLGDSSSPAVQDRPGEPVPSTGILRKDPVCGTFVSEAISIKVKTASGTLHFCSDECRSKYLKASAAS